MTDAQQKDSLKKLYLESTAFDDSLRLNIINLGIKLMAASEPMLEQLRKLIKSSEKEYSALTKSFVHECSTSTGKAKLLNYLILGKADIRNYYQIVTILSENEHLDSHRDTILSLFLDNPSHQKTNVLLKWWGSLEQKDYKPVPASDTFHTLSTITLGLYLTSAWHLYKTHLQNTPKNVFDIDFSSVSPHSDQVLSEEYYQLAKGAEMIFNSFSANFSYERSQADYAAAVAGYQKSHQLEQAQQAAAKKSKADYENRISDLTEWATPIILVNPSLSASDLASRYMTTSNPYNYAEGTLKGIFSGIKKDIIKSALSK
jgi:hypothetical protein